MLNTIENQLHAGRHAQFIKDLGTGALRWVSAGCSSTAILNAGLGFLAGWRLGGPAVVAAAAFSLASGYAIVLVAYHLENRVPFAQLLPKESGGVLFTSFVGVLVFLPFFCATPARSAFSLRVMAGALAALSGLILIPMWVHPLRKRLVRWVFSRVPA
ncbi:MAG: hypothetical protein P4L00_06925 [Candidatus Acidoferrales bacterium]|nr:hypothetical protein [Candidatus Acidoferrales bacterium]